MFCAIEIEWICCLCDWEMVFLWSVLVKLSEFDVYVFGNGVSVVCINEVE